MVDTFVEVMIVTQCATRRFEKKKGEKRMGNYVPVKEESKDGTTFYAHCGRINPAHPMNTFWDAHGRRAVMPSFPN